MSRTDFRKRAFPAALAVSALLHALLLTGVLWLAGGALPDLPQLPWERGVFRAFLVQGAPPQPPRPLPLREVRRAGFGAPPGQEAPGPTFPAPVVERSPLESLGPARGEGEKGGGAGEGRAGGGAAAKTGPGEGGASSAGASAFSSPREPDPGSGPSAVAADSPPRYGENPPPAYPPLARLRGYEGTVVVLAEVRADGLVGEVKLRRSCGHEILDRAALAAVGTWRFEPGRRGGRAVPMSVEVPVRFVLEEKADFARK